MTAPERTPTDPIRGVRSALVSTRVAHPLHQVTAVIAEVLRARHYSLREEAIGFYIDRMFPQIVAAAAGLKTETLMFIRCETTEAVGLELVRDHWRHNAEWIGQKEAEFEWPETIIKIAARRLGARLEARPLSPLHDPVRGVPWMAPIVARLGVDATRMYEVHNMLVG